MEAGVTIVGLKVASGARRAPAGAVGTATRASLQYTHGFVPQCQFPVIFVQDNEHDYATHVILAIC